MAENIALIFQEVFTRIVRHRSGTHQFQDADLFRYDVREAVRSAVAAARAAGYRTAASGDSGFAVVANGTRGDIEMCTLAAVSFLDESVTDQGVFAWYERSLSHEFFGHRDGGKYFFDNLDRLLAREDSRQLADILEVHYLCLLLGFQGQYKGDRGQLYARREAAKKRIQSIRGTPNRLSPAADNAGDTTARPAGSGIRPYLFAAGACLVVALVLFIAFAWVLNSGVSDLQALAARKS